MKDIVIHMAEVFKALGDPNRLRIIRMLASNPERKLCVGALARRLDISQPAVSQHLKVLKNVGLLEANKHGYHVHYAINTEIMTKYKAEFEQLFELALTPCEATPNDCHKKTQ